MHLKTIRQTLGFSQSTMAKTLGISKSYYSELENGRKPLPESLQQRIKEKCVPPADKNIRLKASFDWVAVHFKSTDVESVVKAVLHLEMDDFTLQDFSRYHYPEYWSGSGINLYVNPRDWTQGIAIEMSGSACRTFEAFLQEDQRDWYDFFNDCFLYENELRKIYELPDQENQASYFNVTRLDLALDEPYSETGNVSIRTLYQRFEEGLVACRKRSYRGISEGGQYQGFTLYIGSKSSPMFFRFYEKDVERAKALETTVEWIHDFYGIKNRYEIILRGEKAHRFVQDYINENFNPAEKGVQIINANLTVFSDFQGHLDEEWYDLMDAMEAYRFQMTPKKVDWEKTWTWAEKSVFPTLKALRQVDKKRFRTGLNQAQIPKRYQQLLKETLPKGTKGATTERNHEEGETSPHPIKSAQEG